MITVEKSAERPSISLQLHIRRMKMYPLVSKLSNLGDSKVFFEVLKNIDNTLKKISNLSIVPLFC